MIALNILIILYEKMETILILQIVFIFLMFILNVVCAFIPLKIVPTDPAKLVSRRQQRILSKLNIIYICILSRTFRYYIRKGVSVMVII